MNESLMEVQNGPGSAGYSPAKTQPDALIFATRSTRGNGPTGGAGNTPAVHSRQLLPPSPSTGGEPGQLGRLGWSDGFLAFRRRTSFTGRVITRPSMGVNPAVGEVGLSTRSQRLKNRVAALSTDYTPSSQSVAEEITRNM